MDQNLVSLLDDAPKIILCSNTGIEGNLMFSEANTGNLAQLPQPVSRDISHITKDHEYGRSLLPHASGDILSSVDIRVFDGADNNSLQGSILDSPHAVQEIQVQTEPCRVQVDLTKEVDATVGALLIHENCSNAINQNLDDPGLAEVVEYFQNENDGFTENGQSSFTENVESSSTYFIPLESIKKKNPPYLMRDYNITTKNNELVKFRLLGAKACQTVLVTLRYTEDKFKNNAVNPCRIHEKQDKKGFNFEVSSVAGELNDTPETINGHPIIHFNIGEQNLDSDNNFDFHVKFYCLNSCHKENGKKIELVMKVFEQRNVVTESHFQIRVCKNVKRDYRDAIDDILPPEKRIKPDAMLVKTERESLPMKQVIAEERDLPPMETQEGEENEPLNVVIVQPEVVEATPADNVVECRRSPPDELDNLSPKFYLFQMPTMNKERNVLDTINLMGGKVLTLESVYRVKNSGNLAGVGNACP